MHFYGKACKVDVKFDNDKTIRTRLEQTITAPGYAAGSTRSDHKHDCDNCQQIKKAKTKANGCTKEKNESKSGCCAGEKRRNESSCVDK